MKDYELSEGLESIVEMLIARGIKENPEVLVQVNGQLLSIEDGPEVRDIDGKPVVLLIAQSANTFQLRRMGTISACRRKGHDAHDCNAG